MTTTVYRVQVLSGDCGPDNLVLFHNYSRWTDAAAAQHLRECGVPLWTRIPGAPGRLGAQVLEAQFTFLEAATHPDILQFHTRVEHWRDDEVVLSHRVMRGDTMICEAHVTRAVCTLDASGRAHAVPIAPLRAARLS